MVVHFLQRLICDSSQGCVCGVHQAAVEPKSVVAEDQLPGDGSRKVAIVLFDQATGAELLLIPEVRQVILAVPPGCAGIGEEETGVAQQIQADIG